MLFFVDMDAGPSCYVKGHVVKATKHDGGGSGGSSGSGDKLVCVVKKSEDGFTCIGLDVNYLHGKKHAKLIKILRSEGILDAGKPEL